ncbi:MAG: hypothetical protein M1330_03115 [Armatimonadetes bacterium]|nr:hypothetical protein [Armatimonadota bacterium]
MKLRWLIAVLCIYGLAGLTGCASVPSGATGVSGKRLTVSITFAGPVNPSYYYFFLVNNAADSVGQNGPIPVIAPPYLNGFATGAFTDFVEFNGQQSGTTGYAIYHVVGGIDGDPNRGNFLLVGQPVASQPPNGGNALQFTLVLSQLTPPSGEVDPNHGNLPRYLQVNIIATNLVPRNSQTQVDKYVDAMGDQSSVNSGTFNSYLTIDTSQNRIWSDQNTIAEPAHDVYPGDGDPSIDIVHWSIEASQ